MTKISVQVTPRASQDDIQQMLDGSFKVWVKAAPVKGQANQAVVDVLANHFGVSKSSVKLVSGFTSRRKVFEVDTKN